jgi:UDP-glucose 4-epimerase
MSASTNNIPTAKRTILVTGVSGFWGRRVASALLENPALRVLGLDREPPKETIKGLDFIQADIRNNLLLDLLQSEEVKILVHLAFHESTHLSESNFDLNVMGTMKVFGAAAEAGVEKIILRSSTAVYGANPSNSAFLGEQTPLRAGTASGWIRDLVEIEAFCNGFRRQAPEMLLTILRFPNVIGPSIDTPMTRYLKQTLSPVLLGFEPQMQFLHEDDAIDALIHAVTVDTPGVFNIGAEGVVALDKALAITGRLPVPVFHLFAYWGRNLLGNSQASRFLPIELDYLRYPWVADLRRMREEFEFTPRYTAEEALREFAGHLRMRDYIAEMPDLTFDEERLHDTIERRKRQITRPGSVSSVGGDELTNSPLNGEEEDDE